MSNIAIIGAGFTGLSAAYELTKKGHKITVFEKDQNPGGLAVGYREKNWKWTLEKHYHHWFTNDKFILFLAKEINYPILIRRPHTNWYINGKIYEFDSVTKALTIPVLPIIDRTRNLATLGLLRVSPIWKPLEKFNTHTLLPKLMGVKAYEILWEPLLINKFGTYAKDISLAWFWARIKKRTSSLAYPQRGFLQFAQKLTEEIKKKGGEVVFNTEIKEIVSDNQRVRLKYQTLGNLKLEIGNYDAVVVTLPAFLFMKIAPQLSVSYKNKMQKLKGLGAVNLILRLKTKFFDDNTYWLSIADKTSPIMAIVEHTKFMDKKNYDNEHIVYLGNYLPHSHRYFKMNRQDILKEFDPFLKRINPDYKKNLIGFEVFKAPFAQPIIPVNYSKIIPPIITPLKSVYLANIQQVYPWDRGTNYAVELGQKVAKLIESK